MKFIKDECAYTTSLVLLLLLIPVFMLIIFSISQYEHDINNTADNIEIDRIKSISNDLKTEIVQVSKESLHDVTLNVTRNKRPLTDSRKFIKNLIQERIDSKTSSFEANGFDISVNVLDVDSSDNPFKARLKYSFTISGKTNNINREEVVLIDYADENYPVYDPLPALKSGVNVNSTVINYGGHLEGVLNGNNSIVYHEALQGVVIKKCPVEDYSQHGNSNSTIINCLDNHYYHNSHDGLCLFCRLENKSSCGHYGLETFIVPQTLAEHAPVSIDHVLLNDFDTQYEGDSILLNISTVIYLDNGHKSKYGL